MWQKFYHPTFLVLPAGMSGKDPIRTNPSKQRQNQWEQSIEVEPKDKSEYVDRFSFRFKRDQIQQAETQCQKSQQDAETVYVKLVGLQVRHSLILSLEQTNIP